MLETYEIERKPVGKFTVEQAYTRYVTRTASYLGAKDFEPPANDFNIELGYLYRSPAIISEDQDEKVHDDPRQTFGRPGSRAPHVWLERDGKRVSTIDLNGKTFALIAGPEGGAWCPQHSGRETSRHQAGSALRERQRTARSGSRLPAGLRPARRRRGADPAGRVRRLARDLATGRSASRDGVGAAIDPAGAVTRLVA